ncbi:MAG TPA: O-antigen ligase family protein [Acidimicrobiia bacterium]|nr:O-antigen ligase family protein [Acidimicrobiia bacterium]
MERASPILAALVIGSALIFDPAGWQPFGASKWVLITVTAWLAVAVVLLDGARLHRPSLIGWAVFLLWGAATTWTALDPLSSWIGTPDRRFGMVALLTMAAAYVAGQGVSSDPGRRLVGRSAVLALLGLTVYGLAEALGWAPVELSTTTNRIGSAYGSAAYLGAALCLLVPISAGVAMCADERPAWRLAAAVSVAGGLFLMAASGTQAVLVGLAAAALLTLPAWWVRRRAIVPASFGAIVIVVLAVSPLSERLGTSSVEGRLAEWDVAASVLAAHPVVGVGLEGYRIAFPSHVDVDYVQTYGRSTITDRAHSGPLDLGVALGVPGLVGWVLTAAWLAGRAWAVVDRQSPILTGMAAAVVAVLAQQLVLFPTLEVGVAGWAIAGIIVAAGRRGRSTPIRSSTAATVAALVAVAALGGGLADIVADHMAASARRSGDVTMADRATAIRPDSFRYPLLAADLAFRSGDLEVALDRIEHASGLVSLDPAIRVAQARTLAGLVASGEHPAATGAATVGAIIERDPHHPELRIIHGELLATAGMAVEAERAWLAAAHLAPRHIVPQLRLAELYLAVDRLDRAREALARAREIDRTHPEVDRLEEALDAT